MSEYIYYAYGSWYDGGVDIGYFSTLTNAIIAIFDFLVSEKYKYVCVVAKIKIDDYLRERKQSKDGKKIYCSKEINEVFRMRLKNDF